MDSRYGPTVLSELTSTSTPTPSALLSPCRHAVQVTASPTKAQRLPSSNYADGPVAPDEDAEAAEVEEFEKQTTRVLLNPRDYVVSCCRCPPARKAWDRPCVLGTSVGGGWSILPFAGPYAPSCAATPPPHTHTVPSGLLVVFGKPNQSSCTCTLPGAGPVVFGTIVVGGWSIAPCAGPTATYALSSPPHPPHTPPALHAVPSADPHYLKPAMWAGGAGLYMCGS